MLWPGINTAQCCLDGYILNSHTIDCGVMVGQGVWAGREEPCLMPACGAARALGQTAVSPPEMTNMHQRNSWTSLVVEWLFVRLFYSVASCGIFYINESCSHQENRGL